MNCYFFTSPLFKGKSWKQALIAVTLVLPLSLFVRPACAQAPAGPTVQGTVTDSSGQPLVGVTIKVRGTALGAVTGINGGYTVSVPSDTSTLIVSYIGYDTKMVPVNGQTTLNITLQTSATQLNQLVVVGYGTQRKIDVTGSVAQIDGEEISKQASVNAVSALQGKVAGVHITNSGAPGASPQIRIRGIGTIYGDKNPLYVVDGVWFSDISFLNPADIENISILKDASAESIYGIRAANGVVLITTKKGKAGQITVNYNGYAGWQHVTNMVDMADGGEYAQLINEKSLYSPPPNNDTILKNPAQYGAGTDWYRQVLRDAFVTNHQISVNGGSEKTTYNFSLGYLNQDGIVETNNYQRITASLQNDIQVFKDLKVGYTMVGAGSKSNDINGSIFHQLFAAAPIVPVFYKDSSYGDPQDLELGNTIANPQATIDFYNQTSRNYRITGHVYADLTFLKHFTLHSSFGGEYGENEIRNYRPEYFATANQNSQSSLLTITRDETRNWILENTLTYKNRFGDHDITILAGQSAQRYKSYHLSGQAFNVPHNTSGDLYLSLASVTNSQGDTTVTGLPYSVTDNGDVSTITSYFGRVNYSYKDRYLLNASIRADGSSKFFGSNRWGYFPSVGVGWVISNENFMRDQRVFNTLKLRGSWGKIGNASVPSNISVLTVTQTPELVAIFGDIPYTGASITTIVPPTTYWERGVGTDIGLEAALLENRLNVEADFYNRRTEKAIFEIPILGSLGTTGSNLIGNQATFQNRGVELAVTWEADAGPDFSYRISANGGLNNNKVQSVSTGRTPIYEGGKGATGGVRTNRTIVGGPIGEFFGRQVIGIFQTAEEVAKSAQPNAMPGDFIYKDMNGDGVIDDLDRVPLGNPHPKYVYGINTLFNYKQFDLSLDFQGVADVAVYNANKGLRYGNENYTQDFYDHRWHGEGTSNTYPSANVGGNQNYQANSWFVEDGSYFRVRNIQLGYTLPQALTDRWGIKRLRVYANAQNAFNFFKYTGFSPEVFNDDVGAPTNAGIDTNVYPLHATYNFGVNLSF